MTFSREDVREAKRNVGAFARLIGCPLTDWQAAALTLDRRMTVIKSPRQCGKSFTLSLLALWWAFTKPQQTILIISQSEDSARALLSRIRQIAAGDLLRSSVADENAGTLTLDNASVIRSVAASEKAVRGHTVELLIIDEAAGVSDDLLGAAIPTTAARRDARVVVASSPFGGSGWFYRFYVAGLDGESQDVQTFQWKLTDATWITPEAVEHARRTLPPHRFRQEYEGEFVEADDAYFSRDELLAAVTPHSMLHPSEATGEEVGVGVDWGYAYDAFAVVTVGVLEDFGANPEPVLFVPYLHAAHKLPWADQVRTVADVSLRPGSRQAWQCVDREEPRSYGMGNGWTLHESGWTLPNPADHSPINGFIVRQIVSETNGVGAMPSQELAKLLPYVRVVGVHATQQSKADAYGRLKGLLSQRRMVLPAHEELLRQMQGLSFRITPGGGASIRAETPGIHDDLTDALAMAVSALPLDDLYRRVGAAPTSPQWLVTPSGLFIPAQPRPRRQGLSSNRPQLLSF